jgi:hypothetical protein
LVTAEFEECSAGLPNIEDAYEVAVGGEGSEEVCVVR